MQFIRYIVGAIGFLLVWIVVAAVVGYVVWMFFPPSTEQRAGTQHIYIGIGLDWRNLPGTILGLLAGIQSFRVSVRGKT
jgi:hypothetical protein